MIWIKLFQNCVKTVYGDGKKQFEENIIIFKQEDDYHKPISIFFVDIQC